MELSYDWRRFQAVFQPYRKPALVPGTNSGPVYVVVEDQREDKRIVAAFGDGEDLSDWTGASFQQLASEVLHRELVVFDREQVEHWLKESLALPHFYDQTEFLRNSAIPQTLARGRFKRSSKALALKPGAKVPVERHFLLEALQGWWLKVMPASFGIFLRLEGRLGAEGGPHGEQELFLLIRRGNVSLFCEPDLSFLGNERRKMPSSVVKYLSEKYSVPVQGLFVPREKWRKWSESQDPWKEVFSSLRGHQAKLVPFRWGVASVVAARGLFGI